MNLAEVAATADPGQRMVAFKQAATSIIASSNVEQTAALVDALVGQSVMTVTQEVLRHMSEKFQENEDSVYVAAALEQVLPKLKDVGNAVAAADFAMRRIQYDICQADEDWGGAAKAITEAINIPARERAAMYVCVAQVWLKDDNAGSADMALRRAQEAMPDNTSRAVNIQFRVCRAQVHDFRRNFLQAAAGYMEISQMNDVGLDEGDMLELLNNAIVCVILERAGPRRQRLMSKLIRDDRAEGVEAFFMLEKMYNERIVTPAEAERFKGMLKPHQLARVSGGGTVLERAVREHNVFAASKVYRNISFAALGALIGVDAETAEDLAAVMIQDGRLDGTMDQLDESIEFTDKEEAGGPLLRWDAQLRDVCAAVNTAFEKVAAAHPSLVKD